MRILNSEHAQCPPLGIVCLWATEGGIALTWQGRHECGRNLVGMLVGGERLNPEIGSGCNGARSSNFRSAGNVPIKSPGREKLLIPREKWAGCEFLRISTNSQGNCGLELTPSGSYVTQVSYWERLPGCSIPRSGRFPPSSPYVTDKPLGVCPRQQHPQEWAGCAKYSLLGADSGCQGPWGWRMDRCAHPPITISTPRAFGAIMFMAQDLMGWIRGSAADATPFQVGTHLP